MPMSLSQFPGWSQLGAVVLLGSALASSGITATGNPQTAGANAVVVVGGFSNVRYTPDHAYGQMLKLWRTGERVVGLFSFTDGQQADFDTGLLEKVSFNQATGRLSFESYASQFRFEGTLKTDAVKGMLTRTHPTTGKELSADMVELKRSSELTELMNDYASLDEWNRTAAEIVKRLGLRNKASAK